jgi:hypothetical protein
MSVAVSIGLLLFLGCIVKCHSLQPIGKLIAQPIARHVRMTGLVLPAPSVLFFGRLRKVDMLLRSGRLTLGNNRHPVLLRNSWTDLSVSAVTDGIVAYFAEPLKQMQKVVAGPPVQLFKPMQRIPRNDSSGGNNDRNRPAAEKGRAKTVDFGDAAVDNFKSYVTGLSLGYPLSEAPASFLDDGRDAVSTLSEAYLRAVRGVRDHYATLPGCAAAATHIASISMVYAEAVQLLVSVRASGATAAPAAAKAISTAEPLSGVSATVSAVQTGGVASSPAGSATSAVGAVGAVEVVGPGAKALRPVREAYARSCSAEYAAIAQGRLHGEPGPGLLLRQQQPALQSGPYHGVTVTATKDTAFLERSGLGRIGIAAVGEEGEVVGSHGATQPQAPLVGDPDTKLAKRLVREGNRYVYK